MWLNYGLYMRLYFEIGELWKVNKELNGSLEIILTLTVAD